MTVGIIAGILAARHLNSPDDLFGVTSGSSRSDAIIGAAVQWAAKIMDKVDELNDVPESDGAD